MSDLKKIKNEFLSKLNGKLDIVEINQINQLKEIYTRILEAYFEKV